jgi:hypothetical protein
LSLGLSFREEAALGRMPTRIPRITSRNVL